MDRRIVYFTAIAAISVAFGLAGYREINYRDTPTLNAPLPPPADGVAYLGMIQVTPTDPPREAPADPRRVGLRDRYAGRNIDNDRSHQERQRENSMGMHTTTIGRSMGAAPASDRLLVLLRSLLLPL